MKKEIIKPLFTILFLIILSISYAQDSGENIKVEGMDPLSIELDAIATRPALFSVIQAQDIVINEFVASNDSTSTIADPEGEYEDWIELYNNTNESIDLSGVHLSDQASDLKKWQFPAGSFIDSEGYLIVWADSDEDQEGLHCSFKLNKEGEEIYLSNEDETIIDSISFGEQMTNIAFARNPNGTGDFVFQETTFNANNDNATATTELINAFEVNIYPVPASDFLNVTIQNNNATQYTIDVFSITGQHIFKNIPMASNHAKLDLNDLNDGFYLVTVSDEIGNRISLKFTKY